MRDESTWSNATVMLQDKQLASAWHAYFMGVIRHLPLSIRRQ
jgi:hypothetical protein